MDSRTKCAQKSWDYLVGESLYVARGMDPPQRGWFDQYSRVLAKYWPVLHPPAQKMSPSKGQRDQHHSARLRSQPHRHRRKTDSPRERVSSGVAFLVLLFFPHIQGTNSHLWVEQS